MAPQANAEAVRKLRFPEPLPVQIDTLDTYKQDRR